MKNITISLPEDEYNQVVSEAKEPPYSSNPTEMCRAIVRGRHEMVVQPNVDAERIKSFYEGQLTLLKTANEDLLNRLSAADKSSGLAGLDGKEKSIGRQINEAVEKVRAEMEQKTLKEKYDQAVEQNRLLTERNKELEKENDSLQEGADFHHKAQKYMETGAEALGKLLESSPALQSRIEQGGLAGLVGLNGAGRPIEIGGGSLTEEQQQALVLGQVIRKEFAGDRYKLIVDTIRYLRDHPGVLTSLTGSPKFTAYVAQRQQAA